MKNLLLIFCFVLGGGLVKAQNLVPNPSFEVYSACPTNGNNISDATGWMSFSLSPDYDNTCTINPLISVPSNYFGYQYAASGNGYADIETYCPTFINVREFIASYLTDSLIVGQKYFASIKVSAAYNTAFTDCTCFTNNVGITFSTNNIYPYPITNHAQVYSTSIINDTVNWISVKGSFIADSAYKYIIIGNFFSDSNSIQICQPNAAWAYVYIDDVCIATDSNQCYLSTKVENSVTDNEIELFPNPTQNNFSIKFKNAFIKNYSITIINSLGISLGSYFNICSEKSFDSSNYPDGIYFIEIKLNEKTIHKKLIKN